MMRRAFNILEIIVVVGILSVLAVVLTMATGGSKERAESARCKANLRQLALVCTRYALNEGRFPWGLKTVDGYASYGWDFRRGEDGTLLCGEMFGGDNPDSVLLCPKCVREKTDNWDGNRLTGYNYNVCYLGYVEGDSSARTRPQRLKDIRNPDKVVLFGDGGYSGGPNKFMRAPFQDKEFDNSGASLRKAGTQAFRHGNGKERHCNMAFVDGHVEEFRKPYKAGGSEGWVDEESHTAFIAPDNVLYGKSELSE